MKMFYYLKIVPVLFFVEARLHLAIGIPPHAFFSTCPIKHGSTYSNYLQATFYRLVYDPDRPVITALYPSLRSAAVTPRQVDIDQVPLPPPSDREGEREAFRSLTREGDRLRNERGRGRADADGLTQQTDT